jgi:MtN3 and saliva related transmembrane protein
VLSISMATSIGLVAGCMSSWSLVPQLLKCWRDGLTEAVSKKMFATRAFGLVLWIVYGFFAGSPPVVIFSSINLVLSITILVLTRRNSSPAGPSRTGSDCGHERAEKAASGSHAGSSPGRSSEIRREVAPECDVLDAPQGSDHVREERQGTRQTPLDTRSLAPIPSSPRDFRAKGRATSRLRPGSPSASTGVCWGALRMRNASGLTLSEASRSAVRFRLTSPHILREPPTST